jgi:hypothetical protein
MSWGIYLTKMPHALDVSCYYTVSSLGINMCSMGCTEVPNQIKFVSRPHPTGSRTDFIYTDFEPQVGLVRFLSIKSL